MEFIIIILGIVLDRLTKIWALKKLADGTEIIIIKNFFSFEYLENRGAAWGIFQNKLFFLSAITLILVFAMIFYFVKYKPKSKILRMSLSLIIAGALGNLYDRIIYKYVVDFILVHYKNIYYFPTFNAADMCVVIGTFFMAIYIIKEGK